MKSVFTLLSVAAVATAQQLPETVRPCDTHPTAPNATKTITFAYVSNLRNTLEKDFQDQGWCYKLIKSRIFGSLQLSEELVDAGADIMQFFEDYETKQSFRDEFSELAANGFSSSFDNCADSVCVIDKFCTSLVKISGMENDDLKKQVHENCMYDGFRFQEFIVNGDTAACEFDIVPQSYKGVCEAKEPEQTNDQCIENWQCEEDSTHPWCDKEPCGGDPDEIMCLWWKCKREGECDAFSLVIEECRSGNIDPMEKYKCAYDCDPGYADPTLPQCNFCDCSATPWVKSCQLDCYRYWYMPHCWVNCYANPDHDECWVCTTAPEADATGRIPMLCYANCDLHPEHDHCLATEEKEVNSINIETGMEIDTEWDPSLSDTESDEFKALADSLKDSLGDLWDSLAGDLDGEFDSVEVQITGFEEVLSRRKRSTSTIKAIYIVIMIPSATATGAPAIITAASVQAAVTPTALAAALSASPALAELGAKAEPIVVSEKTTVIVVKIPPTIIRPVQPEPTTTQAPPPKSPKPTRPGPSGTPSGGRSPKPTKPSNEGNLSDDDGDDGAHTHSGVTKDPKVTQQMPATRPESRTRPADDGSDGAHTFAGVTKDPKVTEPMVTRPEGRTRPADDGGDGAHTFAGVTKDPKVTQPMVTMPEGRTRPSDDGSDGAHTFAGVTKEMVTDPSVTRPEGTRPGSDQNDDGAHTFAGVTKPMVTDSGAGTVPSVTRGDNGDDGAHTFSGVTGPMVTEPSLIDENGATMPSQKE